jgi:hypothetical protein
MPEKSTALRRRVAPTVPVEISFSDDKGNFKRTYRVCFNLNVLAEISEKTGISALTIDMWVKLDARVLRAMFWAALLPNHGEEFDTRDRKGGRTDEGLEIVGSWLDGDNQERAARGLWQAYLLYLPKDQAEELEKARKDVEAGTPAAPAPDEGGDLPLASAGSSSGPPPDTISESPKAKSANSPRR